MTPEPLLWLDGLQGSGIRPGLSRMRALLRELGNPERACPSIIVAGTNGKGSTSSTLASILNASGYRTGLYTSPHLVELRERWMIAGTMISTEALVSAIEQLRAAAGRAGIVPTYFEALTLIAFIAFVGCDVMVLEVGMGGRLDATNVVRPLAALITPIGMDHTEYLGTTIRQIAGEKAGVIHRGAIVLTSNDDPRVLGVLRHRAAMFGNPFHVVTSTHPTPLAGDFQQRNAGLAVRAAEELRSLLPQITAESIERGVATTQWRGRLERIERDGKQIWIDGGHNAHAIAAIVPFITEHVPAPRLLVFGIMSDKNIAEVTSALFPLFDAIIATEPYPPRSEAAARLVSLAPDRAMAEADPRLAIERALASGYKSVVIAGSLYLAGAAIEFFSRGDAETRREEE
ncbi:MAG: bifunctional folylpolyglutamate synthase/dihydrofolate synthase [Acidobacteria bacterium]|nr:bifunctional folylpolyglutamate synthase/dihydrofolate synthase [Acidobacteriota bacterium]MBV9070763.1 bifunctional folylpolyglutamate synthase/dihydrofolate synthase [Acidobacteriota bacterium]MBV9186078.1 bifunctional folylpolyglutamate synthase/dihydrofolate synthase [Acidobacteriota bacterium]